MCNNYKPEFIDVTWNAGGQSSELTLEVCKSTQNIIGIDTSMHLTCTNMPIEKIDHALRIAKESGIQNILALRGDPPRDDVKEGCVFQHASDLVKYIRQSYGDYFCIGIAGYPEGHPDTTQKMMELDYLKQKVDAGADFIISQFFYDCELFLKWFQACRDIGIFRI